MNLGKRGAPMARDVAAAVFEAAFCALQDAGSSEFPSAFFADRESPIVTRIVAHLAAHPMHGPAFFGLDEPQHIASPRLFTELPISRMAARTGKALPEGSVDLAIVEPTLYSEHDEDAPRFHPQVVLEAKLDFIRDDVTKDGQVRNLYEHDIERMMTLVGNKGHGFFVVGFHWEAKVGKRGELTPALLARQQKNLDIVKARATKHSNLTVLYFDYVARDGEEKDFGYVRVLGDTRFAKSEWCPFETRRVPIDDPAAAAPQARRNR